jgi:hypothetical protein
MGYFDDARRRAQRRRSPWNLLLNAAVAVPTGLLWWAVVALFQFIHATRYSGQNLSSTPRGLGTILVALAPFFAALPVGMMIGNVLVRLVPPARKVLDQEATSFPNTDFQSAQRQLLRVSMIMVPIALGLAVWGSLLPWHK